MAGEHLSQSIEIAASRYEDITPLVYERMFREMPETEPLLHWIPSHVRGQMLAQSLEALLDFAGERNWALAMFECERTTHATYHVPPEMFLRFFSIIRDTFRELLADEWTSKMEGDWNETLSEIGAIVRTHVTH